jgi:hypothetical protein
MKYKLFKIRPKILNTTLSIYKKIHKLLSHGSNKNSQWAEYCKADSATWCGNKITTVLLLKYHNSVLTTNTIRYYSQPDSSLKFYDISRLNAELSCAYSPSHTWGLPLLLIGSPLATVGEWLSRDGLSGCDLSLVYTASCKSQRESRRHVTSHISLGSNFSFFSFYPVWFASGFTNKIESTI